MNDLSSDNDQALHRVVFVLIIVGLGLTTAYSYLLFHSLVELFSIVVAFSIFVLAWNARSYIDNDYLVFVGIAYPFIGFLDLLHTLSYEGMQIFLDYDYYANQLWIGTRFMESVALLLGFVVLRRGKGLDVHRVFFVYSVVTGFLVASIFYWKVFPVCFVEGTGLTAFKKISEYVIVGILVLDIVFLHFAKRRFEHQVYHWLRYSIAFTIISELAFTFYLANYGVLNLVGHFFKLFSFYLLYRALIETGIREPFKLMFRELALTNKLLHEENQRRLVAELEAKATAEELRQAAEEVQTLSGLLPICASCKKIRDDKGYWNHLETYIQARSGAEFSHGICPECAHMLYGDLADE